MKRFFGRQELNPAFKRFQLLPQLRVGGCRTSQVNTGVGETLPSGVVAQLSEAERQTQTKSADESPIVLSS